MTDPFESRRAKAGAWTVWDTAALVIAAGGAFIMAVLL